MYVERKRIDRVIVRLIEMEREIERKIEGVKIDN